MFGRVLLLNKQWMPIAVTTIRRAISIVCRNHGFIVDHENYERYDWFSWVNTRAVSLESSINQYNYIRTSKMLIEKPKIITLSNFNGVPKRRLAFSRQGVCARDVKSGKAQCQYCGDLLNKKEITIDHIIPLSRGGKNTWENCVVSCVSCNTKKGDNLIEDINMRLLKKPIRPSKFEIMLGRIEPEWKPWVK